MKIKSYSDGSIVIVELGQEDLFRFGECDLAEKWRELPCACDWQSRCRHRADQIWEIRCAEKWNSLPAEIREGHEDPFLQSETNQLTRLQEEIKELKKHLWGRSGTMRGWKHYIHRDADDPPTDGYAGFGPVAWAEWAQRHDRLRDRRNRAQKVFGWARDVLQRWENRLVYGKRPGIRPKRVDCLSCNGTGIMNSGSLGTMVCWECEP